MQQAPKGLRLHIGIFGRRNVGKSSILNALTGQNTALVSEVAGTTADPVEKTMELQPLGPVLFVDTAGIDDEGTLGALRVDRTLSVLDRIDIAVLVTDQWTPFESGLAELLIGKKLPFVVAVNKCDLGTEVSIPERTIPPGHTRVVHASARTGEGMHLLRGALVDLAPEDFVSAPSILPESVRKGDLLLLVIPIDSEAPKGRIILPQVQTLREILDRDAYAVVVKEHQLAEALARLAQGVDEATVRRVRDITGPGRPDRKDAERELRRATLKAAIEAVRAEQDRLLAQVARQGTPIPEDLAIAAQVAARRRTDLEKRLRSLERPG